MRVELKILALRGFQSRVKAQFIQRESGEQRENTNFDGT